MQPIDINLSSYAIQLICPGIHVSTARAFGMLQPRPAGFDLNGIAGLPVDQWKDYIHNDFEEPVFQMHPELREIKQRLYDGGALYASMSGSGSSVYGIFHKGKKAPIIGLEQYYLA